METLEEVYICKEGWLHKRGEHIKTWRPRYFILKSNGHFLGYNNRPIYPNHEIDTHNNLFFLTNCKILTSDKPKNNVFIIKCVGNQNSTVERFFASSNRVEREDWIKAIQGVSNQLNGKNAVKKSIKENEKITLHDFEFLKILGKGTFGKVILCREYCTKRLCAMKILKKSLILEKNEVVHTETENKVMRNIKHPFITSLIYSFQTVDRLCLVMEYVNGGELFFHLTREKKFSENKSRFYCAEICYAIGFLHENNIIYRDIKLENILLDSEGHIKLADFGLCKMNMDYNSKTSTFCGTLEYLAPEIVSKKIGADIGYTRAVDWWAVGVVLYEMLVGRLPFSSRCPETNNQDCHILFDKILKNEICIPLDLGEESKKILCQLLEKNAAKRLGSSFLDFEEIRRHTFFNTIDWEKLKEKKIEPPFRPKVNSDIDTCYFEKEFTGENVQLTPTSTENRISLLNKNSHFDSFSFYGSISSLNSQKSLKSQSSAVSSLHDSEKFDLSSLQADSHSYKMQTLNNRPILKRTRLISHNSLNDEPGNSSFRLKKNDDNFFLASSAFPNIIQFTDRSGNLRHSQTFFPANNDQLKMSTESFTSSESSSSSSNHISGFSGEKNYSGNNIFMKAFYQSHNDLVIDEKMES